MKRNRVFDLLGAKPKNPRWSWCALAANHRGAIFTIWEDRIRDGRSPLSSGDNNQTKQHLPGANEQRQMLEIAIREAIPAYGLVCIAVDPSATPRRIKEVKGEYLVRLRIEQSGSQFFGWHGETIHVLEAAREIQANDALRDLDDSPLGNSTPDRASAIRSTFIRDPQVRAYVLGIAAGQCEYCKEYGFLMPNGRHYLEAHHVISLAEDGRDTVDNVIALCANHHREAHFGASAEQLEIEFITRIQNRPNKLKRADDQFRE
jgi:5-methylcytosine-specific restriction enzyme A